MRKSPSIQFLYILLGFLLVLLVLTCVFTIRITSPATSVMAEPKPVSPAETGLSEQSGLVADGSSICFYTEDGSRFTGGYKELVTDGQSVVYYFLPNGQAFTSGYKALELEGNTHYYFFQEDGTAFTGGLREVSFGEDTYCYYFQEDGKALTCAWQTLDSGTYYFGEDGRAAKETFLALDGKTHYFSNLSTLVTNGWFCIDAEKSYYYADATGAVLSNTVVEGYRLDQNGKCSTKYRINQYVNEHTTPTMSNEEKIQALYDWVRTNSMTYIRTYEHVRSGWSWKDSWVDDMAASQMDNWGGNCFRYAAFLGMLIREATGLPVTVYHGSTPATYGGLTPHSWCEVCLDDQWYVYDVELQKFTAYTRDQCYKIPASESYLHLDGVGTNLFS